MAKYTVEFETDDYQEEQLERLQKCMKEYGCDFDKKSIFRAMMREGSRFMIAEKLAFLEVRNGLGKYKSYDQVYEETKKRIELEQNGEIVTLA